METNLKLSYFLSTKQKGSGGDAPGKRRPYAVWVGDCEAQPKRKWYQRLGYVESIGLPCTAFLTTIACNDVV